MNKKAVAGVVFQWMQTDVCREMWYYFSVESPRGRKDNSNA